MKPAILRRGRSRGFLLLGGLMNALEELEVVGQLRPGVLQHAQNVLHLRIAVLVEQTADARITPSRLAMKIHDVPRWQPGLFAGAWRTVLPFGRVTLRDGSQLRGKNLGTARLPLRFTEHCVRVVAGNIGWNRACVRR